MAGLGAFVSLPEEAVSNVGHVWGGKPASLGSGGSPITRGGHQIPGLISWKLNFPFDWSKNNWGRPLKSGETTGEGWFNCVCFLEPHMGKKTEKSP